MADYFVMLAADISGQPYVKSAHSEILMARLGRTHHSIEFKHQNISAVLDKLGMPWIPGYKPKRNFQSAIFGAIDRYLTKYPTILKPEPSLHSSLPVELDKVFVTPPTLSAPDENIPKPLSQLIRKFDPVERDRRNRSLGKAGEKFVIHLERRRLAAADRDDLAHRVRWIAAEDGDGAGYDVLSFDLSGRERLIEVKTTNGSARTPFFLSRNERDVATARSGEWCIYRVHEFVREPRIFTIDPPLETTVNLIPDTWRASF